MLIREVMTESVVTAEPQQSVRAVAEIMRDRNGRYRVVITNPDGTESVEEVDEPTALIERSVQLMNSLRGEGWKVA